MPPCRVIAGTMNAPGWPCMTNPDVCSQRRQALGKYQRLSQPLLFQDSELVGTDSHYHGTALIAACAAWRTPPPPRPLPPAPALGGCTFAAGARGGIRASGKQWGCQGRPRSQQRMTQRLASKPISHRPGVAARHGRPSCLQGAAVPPRGPSGRCRPPLGLALTHRPGD